ncbi:VIT1/CCC1 transporter family protein [Bartonella queenslandensis]|uniref:VIT1/CCC1 transporter family protein n=1 Tax=Bartonella queenslandensis TaxID=481138 RepID=UPI0005852D73|nr:VIT1/CCC1 transporter family protein [Bartonella queenslandensis]
MLKSFFSFVQRKALFFRSTQKMLLQALKAKKQHAALYLKYAKALESYSSREAAVFTAMGLQELENYKQLLCLSCHNRAHTADELCRRTSFVQSKGSQASQKKIMANQTLKKPSKAQKQTLLTWIQPGLAGLMDGSVSTLAPIFAAAFATGETHQTFLIGLSASIGAGLSMGFTEAAHDDGKLSGRGSPLKRGLASGIMTTLGGLGHTLPYLIHSFYLATVIACIIVFFELGAIVWIQNKYMSTPFWRASLQVIIGGALVFATGILIGSI